MKATDLKKHPPKILFYGPAGTGKTGMLSQMCNGYILDADDGMRTAQNLTDKFTPLRHQVEFDIFQDEDIRKPNAWLRMKKKIYEIAEACRNGSFTIKNADGKPVHFDGVGIDSLTRTCTWAFYQILSQTPRGPKIGIEKELPVQIQDYGMVVSDVRNTLNILLSLPVLVIINTHEAFIEKPDEEDKILIRPSAIGTKIPLQLDGVFDEVWYAAVQRVGAKVNFVYSCLPSASRSVRTRGGAMREIVINDIGLAGFLKEIGYIYPQPAVVKGV